MPWPESLDQLQQTVAGLTQLRGADHPETLVSRAKLARGRQQAGDLPGALSDYEKLLPDLVRALGRERAGSLDVGTTRPIDVESGDIRSAVAEYDKRVQYLLGRLQATFSRLI
jgi:hypothetical protein